MSRRLLVVLSLCACDPVSLGTVADDPDSQPEEPIGLAAVAPRLAAPTPLTPASDRAPSPEVEILGGVAMAADSGVAVWTQWVGGTGVVRLSRLDAYGQPAGEVRTLADGTDPGVAAGHGRFLVTFRRGADLFAAALDEQDDASGVPALLPTGEGNECDVQAAATSEGFFLTFDERVGAECGAFYGLAPDVKALRLAADGSAITEAPVTIAATPTAESSPRLAVVADVAVVAFLADPNATLVERQVHAARFSITDPTTLERFVIDGDADFHDELTVAADASGAMVVWGSAVDADLAGVFIPAIGMPQAPVPLPLTSAASGATAYADDAGFFVAARGDAAAWRYDAAYGWTPIAGSGLLGTRLARTSSGWISAHDPDSDVYARPLRLDLSAAGAPVLVSGGVPYQRRTKLVSTAAGGFVAWNEYRAFTGWDVLGTLVDPATGVADASAVTELAAGPGHQMLSRLVGGEETVLATWYDGSGTYAARFDARSLNRRDSSPVAIDPALLEEIVAAPGGFVVLTTGYDLPLTASRLLDDGTLGPATVVAPAAEGVYGATASSNGTELLVAWSTSRSGYDVLARRLDATSLTPLDEAPLTIADTAAAEYDARVATNGRDFTVLFASYEGVGDASDLLSVRVSHQGGVFDAEPIRVARPGTPIDEVTFISGPAGCLVTWLEPAGDEHGAPAVLRAMHLFGSADDLFGGVVSTAAIDVADGLGRSLSAMAGAAGEFVIAYSVLDSANLTERAAVRRVVVAEPR